MKIDLKQPRRWISTDRTGGSRHHTHSLGRSTLLWCRWSWRVKCGMRSLMRCRSHMIQKRLRLSGRESDTGIRKTNLIDAIGWLTSGTEKRPSPTDGWESHPGTNLFRYGGLRSQEGCLAKYTKWSRVDLYQVWTITSIGWYMTCIYYIRRVMWNETARKSYRRYRRYGHRPTR